MLVYIGIDWSTQKHDIVYLNEEEGLSYIKRSHIVPRGLSP